MADVTFISDVAQHCSISLSNPDLIVAWAQTLAGKITPAQYLDLYRHVFPDQDAVKSATELVNACMGEAF